MALKCQKIFITYGRFQPVTWGHENSFNAIKSAADKSGCDYRIFISHTNDKKDNPLSQGDKLAWMKLLLPDHAKKILAINPSSPQKCVRYCMTKSKDIAHDYDECVYMVGSDRVNAMQYLHNYNGCNPKATVIDFSMKHFEIRSTGQRDADGKTFSISGTKMRDWARSGDLKEFKKGLPKSNKLKDEEIEAFMALL
jgi:nicotinic acid mononucleotide adenylyltransferase